ncbi:hypothetical protein SUDANB32_05658 [Streptomyces sp. enrichment culture]
MVTPDEYLARPGAVPAGLRTTTASTRSGAGSGAGTVPDTRTAYRGRRSPRGYDAGRRAEATARAVAADATPSTAPAATSPG